MRRQVLEFGNEELDFGRIAFEMLVRQPNRDESRQLEQKMVRSLRKRSGLLRYIWETLAYRCHSKA